MSDKEKLIELIHENVEITLVEEESLADHLISNGVTVQKWIPVSERLPELGQEVLVTQNNSCGIMAVWRLFRSTISEVFYWEDEVGDELYVEAASHWMPLPEPPKECE